MTDTEKTFVEKMLDVQKATAQMFGIPLEEVSPSTSTGFYWFMQHKITRIGNEIFWCVEIIARVITVLPLAIISGLWRGFKDNIDELF